MKLFVGKTPLIVACPSYKRPGGVETLKYLPETYVYVANSEAIAYKKANPKANIVPVMDKYQGNLCRIRNHILDQNRGAIVCLIDDDLQWIGYFEGGSRHVLESPKRVASFLWKYSVMAVDMGVSLWGINVNTDLQCYREYTPFSTISYIGGPFMVHVNTQLRFDESLPLKEDYDFSLQALNQDRKVLRVNKYHYATRQAGSSGAAFKGQAGGCAAYRSLDAEKAQFLLLQKKWGEEIVQGGDLESSANHRTTKEKNFDINPVIRVPIQGV
jgi:hypothetical protein